MQSDGVYFDAEHTWDHDGDSSTSEIAEASSNSATNDPSNDNPMWRGTRIVEDKEKSFDVWGVSVTYTDGPMALSLGHMVHETDAGTERTATMFSAAYTLAPGVTWKSSIFGVEDNTADLNDDKMEDTVEGTGFVTGLRIDLLTLPFTGIKTGGPPPGGPFFCMARPSRKRYWIHTSCLMRYPRCMARNW